MRNHLSLNTVLHTVDREISDGRKTQLCLFVYSCVRILNFQENTQFIFAFCDFLIFWDPLGPMVGLAMGIIVVETVALTFIS